MRITATEASRGFSDLLSRVAEGETVEVDRHGQVVAVLSPARQTTLSGADLLALIARLPHPDERFARDVGTLAEITISPGDPWQS